MKRYLTEQEQRQLLKAAKDCADPLAQRDYHWMSALILTGMRIQEWSRLTAEQARLALRTGWIISLKEHCKGKARANDYLVTQPLRVHLQALLALSDEIAQAIELDETTQMQPLLWGRAQDGHAGALSVRSYEARMKVWAAAAGLDTRISPHWLRHTLGMNIMRRSRGKDALRVAKLALNHSSIRSTGIYTQMSREEFEREMHFVHGSRVPRRMARQLVERAL
jgi:site-specific recombinase XerD